MLNAQQSTTIIYQIHLTRMQHLRREIPRGSLSQQPRQIYLSTPKHACGKTTIHGSIIKGTSDCKVLSAAVSGRGGPLAGPTDRPAGEDLTSGLTRERPASVVLVRAPHGRGRVRSPRVCVGGFLVVGGGCASKFCA